MNDVELGPEEKSLIAAAREGIPPSEVQRARVSRGLEIKLAAAAAVPLLTGSTALAMVGKIGAGIALVAAVGAGAAYVATARPRYKPAAPIQEPAAPAALAMPRVAAPPPVVPAEAAPLVAPRPSAAHPRKPIHRPEASALPAADLAGELASLTQVNAALKGGDVARAGELLRDYDQRFPSGKLAEERAAAGVLVLCASGSTQSASTEARRFVERWPRSPLVVRIKASCNGVGWSP
jgi:hypothetical protein